MPSPSSLALILALTLTFALTASCTQSSTCNRDIGQPCGWRTGGRRCPSGTCCNAIVGLCLADKLSCGKLCDRGCGACEAPRSPLPPCLPSNTPCPSTTSTTSRSSTPSSPSVTPAKCTTASTAYTTTTVTITSPTSTTTVFSTVLATITSTPLPPIAPAVTSTVTATATTTVPAPAGFIAIQDSLPGSSFEQGPLTPPRDNDPFGKRDEAEAEVWSDQEGVRRKRTAPSPSPSCVTVTSTVTSSVAVSASTTVTVTSPTTSTITITAPAGTPAAPSTVTVTTTTTSSLYAACTAPNQINRINGGVTIQQRTKQPLNMLDPRRIDDGGILVASAYACCVRALQYSAAPVAAYQYTEINGLCTLYKSQSATCVPGGDNGYILQYRNGFPYDTYVFGNGPCGVYNTGESF